MDVIEDSPSSNLLPFYIPFYPQSTTVITSNSNSGKTLLVLELIRKRNLCFSRPFNQALIVLGNETVDGQIYRNLSDETLTVETCYFDEFNVRDHVTDNLFLVFEDVTKLTADILECINVSSHHHNLASTVLIVQSVLSDPHFKTLLGLAHRVIIFFSGTGGSKLAKYIQQFLFVSPAIKEYLKNIISFAENQKSIVLFEINPIAREDKPKYFAIANVDHFLSEANMKPIVVFPQLNEQDSYESEFGENQSVVDGVDPSKLPPGSYVLVKAENVFKKNSSNSGTKTECANSDWSQATENIVQDIESSIKFQKQLAAKNLARAILKCKYFCVTKDGKAMMVKEQPKTKVPILDFLNAAIRMSGPNEIPDPRFSLIAKYLIQADTPLSFFKNKTLLENPSAVRRRQKKKQQQQLKKLFK